jgi:hypothetical protein
MARRPKGRLVTWLTSDHSILFLFNSSRAIRSRFGAAIKTKTLTDAFKGVSITNTSTHATRVRVAIMKVISS